MCVFVCNKLTITKTAYFLLSMLEIRQIVANCKSLEVIIGTEATALSCTCATASTGRSAAAPGGTADRAPAPVIGTV